MRCCPLHIDSSPHGLLIDSSPHELLPCPASAQDARPPPHGPTRATMRWCLTRRGRRASCRPCTGACGPSAPEWAACGSGTVSCVCRVVVPPGVKVQALQMVKNEKGETVTGHIISTTIGGENSEPKQGHGVRFIKNQPRLLSDPGPVMTKFTIALRESSSHYKNQGPCNICSDKRHVF